MLPAIAALICSVATLLSSLVVLLMTVRVERALQAHARAVNPLGFVPCEDCNGTGSARDELACGVCRGSGLRSSRERSTK